MFKPLKFFLFTISIVILISSKVFAQGVGINDDGTAPANSAILDVKAADKGILIPRISLDDTVDVTSISSPETSLIVHNTNASMTGGNGIGLYQWSGSKWVNLIAPANGPGADGEVLTAKGSGNSPVWKAASSGGSCFSGQQVVSASSGCCASSVTATCPAGKIVIGGGCRRGSASIESSHPSSSGNGWVCSSSGGSLNNAFSYAICVDQ